MGRGSPRGRSWVPPVFCQATGDRNKLIMIWDAATCKRLHIFTGHHDAVSVSRGHRLERLQGQAAPFSPVPLTAIPVSICLSVCRACPSGRAHTSCTVPPTTAASRSGMWRRMHMWRPCKTRRGTPLGEAMWQRAVPAAALCHLPLQVRAPGRHHGAGQPEPGVLCDGGGTGRHRAALEDP